jgi:oligoendopeptidase F
MARAVPPRAEAAREHTWDVDSIFASDAEWEAELEAVKEELPGLSRFRGRLGDSAQALADYLRASEQVLRRVGKVAVYGTLGYAADTKDQAAVARSDRARSLYARALAATAFAEPEMLALGEGTLHQWTREEPRLATYAHYFDQLLRRAEHVRSAEVEELLRQVQEPFGAASATHGVLANADLTFRPAREETGAPVDIAQGNIGALLTHGDRLVRRGAWESYADAHLAMKNTLANCLAAGVKQNVFLARARGYESALHAALSPNQIPVAVFHNLVETYRRHLPTWHRYWSLRRRALGYDTLHVYDIKAPLTAQTPAVPYAQAVEWIAEGMRPLGDEYVSVLRRGATEGRWVDKYPNEGKRQGAFSSGAPGTHPFILMSYNDDLSGLSTLAHELGHSLHSYYSWQTQPFVYSRYSLFVAEVASNFNQALVRAHLLETHTDPDFQIALIEEAMSNFHRYFFVMPTLARFELEIHRRVERGDALTAQSLLSLMADLLGEGYGDEVEIDADRTGSAWMQFPSHMYANFYVFQYATGISGAHALAERVLAGEPGAAERYLSFLKAGGSLYPLDALKQAGVDLSTPEPVERTFAVLSRMVDRLENLLDEHRRRAPRP